jgi:hypothetical protein
MSAQLTSFESFKASNIIFDVCQKRNIPDSEVCYHQSNVQYRYADGTKGPLIFQLPRCPSFGVSNKYGDGADKISLSLILGDKDNYSEEHKRAVAVLQDVVQACKTYTLTEETKGKLGVYDLEERDLKDMTFLKLQKDKTTNKPYFDRPPVLNVKFSTRNNKETKVKEITSTFCNENDLDVNGEPKPCDPREFIAKPGTCVCLVRVDNIYYGTKYKIQVKIYQADYKANETGFRSLIKRTQQIPQSFASLKAEDMDDFMGDEEDVDTETMVSIKPSIMPSAPAVQDEDMNGDNDDDEDLPDGPVAPPQPQPVASPPAASAASSAKAPARRTAKK